ncbi:MAG: hypothetical protein DRQ47_05460 [Gammaproteobacteria bacterium]|nr:MAG: hypothetical protein DRQ47_05460 [Gammaproteobacteria bacterium]
MLDKLKPLFENDLFSESDKTEIQEQWDKTLLEAKSSIKSQLREEFAKKYSHDKKTMIKALDKMVTEGLHSEIAEFRDEKANIAEDRVKSQRKLQENANKFNNFMTSQLAKEVKQLREDRKEQFKGMKMMEGFVAKHLSKEIVEFANDKRDLVETKVRLVSEASQKLSAIKKKFVAESSKKVSQHISQSLNKELTSLNEDIKSARENSFGRRIFEAFSSEFTTTHLNENAAIRKLQKELTNKDSQLNETFSVAKKYKQLTESKNKEIQNIKEHNERTDTLDELLRPLRTDKKEVMHNLLENVQTNRLQGAFEKYLPSVLNSNTKTTKASNSKRNLNESVARTGNKTAKPKKDNNYDNNIVDIKKLAGLK